MPLAPIITGPHTAPVDNSEDAAALIIVRRGLWAFAAFIAGLVAGRYLPGVPGSLWLGLSAALLAGAILVSGRTLSSLLLAATVLAGAGWFAIRVHEVPADSLLVYHARERAEPAESSQPPASGDTPITIVVTGTILDRPRIDLGESDPRSPGFGRGPTTTFNLDLDGILIGDSLAPASGRARVLVREKVGGADSGDIRAGSRVQVRGAFEPVAAPRFPGEEDPRLWAAQEHRVGRLTAASAAMVETANENPGIIAAARRAWLRSLASLRSAAADTFAEAMGEDDPDGSGQTARALLGALLIGTDDRALTSTSGIFSRLGLVHILSISGFHLALMATMLSVVLRLAGDWPRLFAIVVGMVVAVYLLIVPAEAPVLRSGIAVLVFLLCEAAGRRYDRINVLALIAVALLIWRPMDLFAAGFQLSFGVTAVLLWLGGPLHRAWFGPALRGGYEQGAREKHTPVARTGRWLRGAFTGAVSTGVLAWAVSTPLVIFHTGLVAPLAMVIGLPLTLVFSLLLGLGYAALLLALIWPKSLMGDGPVVWCGWVLERLSEWTLALTNWLDVLPGMTLSLPRVSIAWTALATLAALSWLVPRDMQPWRRLDPHGIGRYFATSLVLLWLAVVVACAARVPEHELGESGWKRDEFVLSAHAPPAVLMRRAGEAVLSIPDTAKSRDLSRALPGAVRAAGGWQVRTVQLERTGGRRMAGGLAEGLDELAARLGVIELIVDPAFAGLAQQRPSSEEGRAKALLERRGVRVTVRPESPAADPQ